MGTALLGGDMRVELRCYGAVRRSVGESSVALELADGATVGDALAALADRADGDLPTGSVVMRERRHLDRGTELADGDVISVTDSPMPEG
ncbi:molybdopterin synthase sulfur carrier subunit [Halobacteriales archaeon QS_5_70_15]|nr:MAG: molybdopterin synthase sulfur carrier subunit [Halobacteriales archaeon QS_5_70_15]